MKEEDSTNRTGILRNAPNGIKLYSPAFGDCKLSCVIEDEMTIEYFDGKNPDYITLDKYGRFKEDGECILYPNKYKLDWNGWQAWLFRDELSIGKVVVDALGGCFIIINNSDVIKVADASGKEHILESKELDKFRFATQAERIEFFEYLERNNCHWDREAKAILENTKKEEFIEESKNNSKFRDGDIVTVVKPNNGWTEYYIGIVIGPYICGSDFSKTTINKALSFEIRYATEQEKHKFLSEWEEPKELYTDEEAKEFASKISHEWWQMAMDKWNTLTEDEKKKYNQYIGFNDFSDHLMNILRSVLLGLKRNGKLIYEEGSLFSEPDQKLAEIELDETPNGVVCMPRVLDNQVQTITEDIAPKVSINSRFAKVEPSDLTHIEEPKEEVVELVFPELAESEDEKIRKELLEHCINRTDGKQVCVDASDYRRWADWLFRQGVENIPNVKSDKEKLNETPIPCYEPKYSSCTGNCGYCVYHTTTGCSKKIEYDKSGCESSGEYNFVCESGVSSGEYDSACATKNNKYIPKLKVGDKACLSDKNDNIYFEEILKVNDEEYYTKTFGWINCKAIDELHEINFKIYNKPFTIGDFKQFDKVLWRLGPADTWSIGLFDNYYICGEDNKVSYSVVGYEKDWVPQCVPYNIDTAYLHDTDKEYDGKYKTW